MRLGPRVSTSEGASLAPATRLTFDEAYTQHVKIVLQWSLRYLGGHRSQAEDLAQEVFARLFERFDEVDQGTDLAHWLYRVTANLAISHFRREGRLKQRLRTFLGMESDQGAHPEDTFGTHETARACERAIQALPTQQRVVLWMKLVDELSQREIAASLSMSEGQVSKLVSRGLATLREKGFEGQP